MIASMIDSCPPPTEVVTLECHQCGGAIVLVDWIV
jgi:hypothetical protein